MRALLSLLLIVVAWFAAPAHAGPVVVIGHPGVPKLDAATVERIYTGKVIQVEGIRVIPVNLVAGNYLRTRFLREILNQDEEHYTGYWTVRRYVGKGVPPREFSNVAEMLSFVSSTPGAVGYVDENDLKGGAVSVLMRR